MFLVVTQQRYVRTMSLALSCLAGFFDDLERGENGWWSEVRGSPSNTHNDWQYGTPQGKANDPNGAFSGSYCWGNDMGYDDYAGTSWNGYYQHDVNIYLNSPVIDCSDYSNVGLSFKRWLNVASNDVAQVLVNDQPVWTSPVSGVYDNSWTEQLLDISALADGNEQVTISFGLTSNGSSAAGGWNIDDILIGDQLAVSVPTAEDAASPDIYHLYQNYPNPFNPFTTIHYQLPRSAHVKLTVFNLLGREVRTLIDKVQTPGFHAVEWNGADAHNRNLASGIYLLRLDVSTETEGVLYSRVRKMMFIQ